MHKAITIRISEELWDIMHQESFESKKSKNTIINIALNDQYAEKLKLYKESKNKEV